MKLYDYPVTGTFEDHKKWTTSQLCGIDFGTGNDPIVPIKSGTVTFIGEDPKSINPRNGSKAKYIILRENPNDERFYVHLSEITAVVGQFLDPDKGDIVGFGGDTGNTTGAHTHVMKYHDGVSIDFQDELNELKRIDMLNRPVAGNEPPQKPYYSQKELDDKLKPLQDQIGSLNSVNIGLNTELEKMTVNLSTSDEALKVSQQSTKDLQDHLDTLQAQISANKTGLLQTILNFILKK